MLLWRFASANALFTFAKALTNAYGDGDSGCIVTYNDHLLFIHNILPPLHLNNIFSSFFQTLFKDL